MTGYARAAVSGKSPALMRVGKNYLSDLIDGGAGYPGDYLGKIYYVNNITGVSTNDGSSWESAMDEVSTAITAWETYRAALTTNNTNLRGRIYIQATGTAYSALTDLPNWCDMIGIGANPLGNGQGIARIHSEDGDACASDTAYGLDMYNLQFSSSAGTGYYAMDIVTALQCTFQNCAFMSHAGTSALSAAVRIAGNFAGCIVRDCTFGMTNGAYACSIGLEQSAGVGNNNWIEGNIFLGVVHAVKIASTTNDHGTVWKNNVMHSHLGTTEPSTAGLQMGMYSIAVDNYVVGADAITEADATQTIWNKTQAGDASVYEDAET